MTNQPETLDLRSQDIAEDKRQEILRLFPEVRTEGGKLDFERLKLALGEAVDVGRERYGMNWPGKAECFKTIQAPSLGTLRPCPDEGVNFDTTENLIIEGDNLEVLKLLQKSYLGKVKMIYIDPPYNTGKDFIYPDNYTESLQTYLEYTGQVDAEGRKFGTNTDADGRYHSKWLNMMFPRLYLARNLLRDDGVVFISIDDHEVDNLRKLCHEVFGEENFIAQIVWQKKQSPQNDATNLSDMHDYILVFAKRAKIAKTDDEGWQRNLLPRTETQDQRYTNPDNDPRGPWTSADYTCNKSADQRPNLYYPIRNPNTGKDVWPSKQRVWGAEPALTEQNLAENRLWWGATGDGMPRAKRFLSEVQGGIVPSTWWTRDDAGDNQEASREFRDILSEAADSFDTPKPSRLIGKMLSIATNASTQDIVLDFFAGSGTTAQAVLQLNRQDGGSRRWVLVQLPEPTGRTDFPTIADICKQRVRRVIKKFNDEDAAKFDMDSDSKPDRGFRVFKLDQSNFTTWDAGIRHDPAVLERQLELHVEHIRDGRSDDDILYEMLLKSGYPLTVPAEKQTLAGKTVYNVADGLFIICMERELTLDLVRAIAERKPERVALLDEGFAGNDQLKANAVQIFKTKGVTSFKTV
jgi:adenine-specific DNA-methyltransferase